MLRVLFFLLFIPCVNHAQLYLKPSIGVWSEPLNSDSIASIPVYTGGFYTTGLEAGDTAFDFKLFTVTGDSVQLAEILITGKPLLIVNGNYTCPVFRNKVSTINQVASAYAGLLNVIIVYTVEAHPTTISPYFGVINTTSTNINAGILFPQPLTYLDRRNIAGVMLNAMTINVPVYLDGPSNPWWSTYGPAPNNAYLIRPDGVIFSKHGWFDKNPVDNIFCDVDSLLYNLPCTPTGSPGNFTMQQLNTTTTGAAGSIIYGYTDLINSTTTPINVNAKKVQQNLPSNWQSAFCADVCYPPSEDSVVFSIPALDTIHFSIDFITSPLPDSGTIKIGFRNIDNSSNKYTINVKGVTQIPTSVGDVDNLHGFTLYPNPAQDILTIRLPENFQMPASVDLLDYQGKLLRSMLLEDTEGSLSMESFPKGFYIIRCNKYVKVFLKK